jgi:hypothetical protein
MRPAIKGQACFQDEWDVTVKKAMIQHAPIGAHTKKTKGIVFAIWNHESAMTPKINPVMSPRGTASFQLTALNSLGVVSKR